MTDSIRIGLLGCGVVGGGVAEVLGKHRDRLVKRFGRPVEIRRIAVRDEKKPRVSWVPKERLCGDWREVCTSPDIDVVIEVMGGTTAAGDAVGLALSNGKHVITANKELLAADGAGLYDLAREQGVRLECEASVLGGIPALHTLNSYFRINRISRLRGIVNGTSNYILTRMHEEETEFSEALKEAQALGYAEPNPANDIQGRDAFYKLKILIQYATGFAGAPWDLKLDPVGIEGVTQGRIQAAKRQGRKIKHLVQAQWDDAGQLRHVSVGPVELPPEDPLYHVDGVQNSLSIVGDVVGEILLTGPGAGALPTASAIVEDLAKIYGDSGTWQSRRTAVAF